MGDREIKQFNRILFAKFGNRTQELHLQRLKNDIKPVIDNSSPPQFAHLSDRRKVKQRWSDEQTRIEYENMILLQKMRNIMTETQNKQFLDASHPNSAQGGSQSIISSSSIEHRQGSLNRGERIKEMKRILHENEALLSRIQARGPTYHVAEWEASHIQKEKQLAGMGRFPYHSTTLPPQIMADLQRAKPIKRYGTMRYPVQKPSHDHSGEKRRTANGYSNLEPSVDESPSEGSSSQPITPVKASPRRVHHLPPKSFTEEKQEYQRKKSASKKTSKSGVAPIQISFNIEHLTEQMTDANDSIRVLVYLRADTGEYVPTSEVHLTSVTNSDHSISFTGLTEVPGLSPAADDSSDAAAADRRVRVALFHASDPAFAAATSSSGLAVPRDNTHLLGEARFSLQHFINFPRPLYKLKVLKHGLPISGPNFATAQNAPNGAANSYLSEEEITRRRSLPETILVLQYHNKPVPEPDPEVDRAEEEDYSVDPMEAETESTTISEAKAESKSDMARQFDEAAANATSPKSAAAPSQPQPEAAASHLRVAVSGVSTSFQPKAPAVYLFLLSGDGDDVSEKTIGSSEKFTGKTNGGGSGSSVVAPVFHKSIAVKDVAGLAAKGATLRLALYDTAVPTSAGHTQSKAPEAKRTTLLSDVKISAADLLEHVSSESLWRLEGTKHSAHDSSSSSSKRASSATSTAHPIFLVHIASFAAGADSSEWVKAVESKRAELAVEAKRASDARAAVLAAEQKQAKHTADLERTKKIRAALLSDAGQAVVSYYSPASEEEAIVDADKLLTAANKAGEGFVVAFITSSSDAYRNYNTVAELAVNVKAGYDALVAARHSIVFQLSLDGCKLLPHSGNSSPFKSSSSNAEVDGLASDSGLPLLPLADVCANNANTIVQRLQALDAKGVSYSTAKQLAAAIKEEGEAQAAAAAAAAAQDEYYQEDAAPADAEAAPVAAEAEPVAASASTEKSAADVLAEFQAAKAAQEAEVARVMAEKGLTAPKNEYEEEEEWSKPYVEDPPASEQQQPAPAATADEYNDEFPPAAEVAAESTPAASELAPKVTKQPSRFSDNPELAATKIQAVARGRSVRNKKDAIRAEKAAAKEAARHSKESAARKLAEQEKRDDEAAETKRAAETEAKRKAAEEEEKRIAKQKEDDAALLARTKAAEAEAAVAKEKAEKEAEAHREEETQARAAEEARKREELAAKVREAEEAKRTADAEAAAKVAAEAAEKAQAEAAAKKVEQEWQTKVEQWQTANAHTNFAMNLTVGCKGLNASSSKDCHPMIALYGKAPDGSFSFVSQTERIQATCDPVFAEPLQIDPVNGKGARGTDEDRQYMFSIYNVANEDDIKETDVIGTALITQSQLYDLIGRDRVAAPFISISLPISHNGSEISGAFVTVTKILVGSSSAAATEASNTPASTAKSSSNAAASSSVVPAEGGVVIGPGDVGIFVSIKNIILPKGVSECNSLAALYTKDHESSNFNYVSQTDQVTGSTSPKFVAPLVIARPEVGHDTDCMLNVYNHLSDDAEVTDDAALGACLFSLNRLLTSSRGAIAVALVKDGEIRGQVILRTKADASSTDVSRPASAVVSKSSNSTKSDAPIPDTYDLRITCSNLPQRADQSATNAMVALYGQDPATNNFAYIAQTEKFDDSRNPTFESLIRLDAQSGGGGAADRPLMLMIYSVVDENNISEEDQIGTCALKWSFLKEQANTDKKSLTLPLLDKNGAQEKEASITIQIIPVKSL